MDKNEVLKILETAKDENGEVPMRLVRQAFEKLPEPCEDTISRRLVIDAICDNCDTVEASCPHYPCGRYMAVEKLPSAQPEPQWVPVSERLPEDCTDVFVYLFESPSPYIAWVEDTRWNTEDFEVDREDEPIAWMPLPKPWRGEKNDTD